MSDETSPEEKASATPQGRRLSRRLALAPLWMASVLVLSLAIAGLGAYLAMRQSDVVERVLPPPPQSEDTAEAARRAEALRALNDGLREQVEALHRELEHPPQCPPGTELNSANGWRKV